VAQCCLAYVNIHMYFWTQAASWLAPNLLRPANIRRGETFGEGTVIMEHWQPRQAPKRGLEAHQR